MRQKPRQIKFYCTENQFQGLQQLRVSRNMSMQDLMMEAVEYLLEDLQRGLEIDRDMMLNAALDIGLVPAKSEAFYLRKGEQPLVALWMDCIRQLPDSTVRAMRQLMQDALRFFQSARLKPKKSSEEK